MNVSSVEYRAEKGKKSVVYAVVMKKLKITKEEAVGEALKFGLEIPEEEFEMVENSMAGLIMYLNDFDDN